MEIELDDGTSVRGVNGGSLGSAAYDFNCGDDPENHLHVYLSLNPSHGFKFLCANRSLEWEQREEAERQLQETIVTKRVEQKQLLQRLLANTDGIIEEMQGAISDKNDAPVDVRRAVGFEPRSPLRSWADVKAQLAQLRTAA